MQSNHNFLISFFLCLTVFHYSVIANENLGDEDENAINVRTWEDFKMSRPEEIVNNCELDEMRAYSLSGDATSLSEPNEICPAIKENCCGKKDQEAIVALWRRDSKRIQYHTTYTLKVFRYILGHGKNFYKLARKIAEDFKRKGPNSFAPITMQTNNNQNQTNQVVPEDSDGYVLNTNQYCATAAHDVLTTNFFHESSVEPFYQQLNHKAEYLHNVRASFYCMLCSKEGQDAISSWRITWSDVNYGTDFCKEIVAHTFQATFMLYENYNTLLGNIIKMLTCIQVPMDNQTNNSNLGQGGNPNQGSNQDYTSTEPPFPLSEGVLDMIKNPLGMSDFGSTYSCDLATGGSFMWFTLCEYYCQKFNIAKANAFFEYDTFRLRNLFDYLSQYEPVFPNGSVTNMFKDDTITLKKEISELYRKLPYEGLFFVSKDNRIDLAKYHTDFTRLGSYNPMADAVDHKLEFHYQSATNFMVGLILAITTLWFF